MIKRVMRLRTTTLLLFTAIGGCTPVANQRVQGPTTSVSNSPVVTISTQPTILLASAEPARAVQPIAASTRGGATRPAENPSSQPADVAALADRAGGLAGGQIVGAIAAALQADSIERAQRANDQAEQHPAPVAGVLARAVADLNADGFITLDEITAMKRAGLIESQMLERLRQSQAIFSASVRQQQYLRDRGVPEAVVKLVAGPSAATR